MYGILLSLMKIIMHRYTVYGIENIAENRSAIYVCNHAGSYGPLAMGLFFPYRFRPWVIHRAMTAGLCRRQLELDLFGDCKAVFKPFCRLASFIIEPACLWVMRKTRAIPVYRGGAGIFTTFRQVVPEPMASQGELNGLTKKVIENNDPFSPDVMVFTSGTFNFQIDRCSGEQVLQVDQNRQERPVELSPFNFLI